MYIIIGCLELLAATCLCSIETLGVLLYVTLTAWLFLWWSKSLKFVTCWYCHYLFSFVLTMIKPSPLIVWPNVGYVKRPHMTQTIPQLIAATNNGQLQIRLLAVSHFLDGKNRTQIVNFLNVSRTSVNKWVQAHWMKVWRKESTPVDQKHLVISSWINSSVSY